MLLLEKKSEMVFEKYDVLVPLFHFYEFLCIYSVFEIH